MWMHDMFMNGQLRNCLYVCDKLLGINAAVPSQFHPQLCDHRTFLIYPEVL